MVFHADLNLEFFANPSNTTRVRGMFIADLAYPDERDRLAMGSLQFQAGDKQKTMPKRVFV